MGLAGGVFVVVVVQIYKEVCGVLIARGRILEILNRMRYKFLIDYLKL
jgi:hypothetical protein